MTSVACRQSPDGLRGTTFQCKAVMSVRRRRASETAAAHLGRYLLLMAASRFAGEARGPVRENSSSKIQCSRSSPAGHRCGARRSVSGLVGGSLGTYPLEQDPDPNSRPRRRSRGAWFWARSWPAGCWLGSGESGRGEVPLLTSGTGEPLRPRSAKPPLADDHEEGRRHNQDRPERWAVGPSAMPAEQ